MQTQLPPQMRENTILIRSREHSDKSVKDYAAEAATKLFSQGLRVVYLSGTGKAISDVVSAGEILRRVYTANYVYGATGTLRFKDSEDSYRGRTASKLVIGFSREKREPICTNLEEETVMARPRI